MENELRDIFFDSVSQFLTSERENISSGVSERNLCARLAFILENKAKEIGLSEFFVDPEYNRMQNGKVKFTRNKDMEVVTITCDIILHSRGKYIGEKDNLIAIEMKKNTASDKEKNKDRTRLMALTTSPYGQIWSYDGTTHPEHVCGYNIGFYMEISEKGDFIIEEYVGGEIKQVYNNNVNL